VSPSLATGKTGAAPKGAALNTATVRPAQVSTVQRFVPHYLGEPVAGHAQNPDGSWVAPGGKFQPGAHLALRPYYTDAYTTHHGAGPTGQESTQWNAAQVSLAHQLQKQNYGLPGYLLRSLLPGGLDEGGAKTPGQAVKAGVDIGSYLIPVGGGAVKAAGILGLGGKALRGAGILKGVAEEVPAAAHTTEEAGAVRAALPGAKIVRGKQEAGYSTERGKRVAAGQAHLDNPNLPPGVRIARAKAEQAGELPKINFRGFSELNNESLEVLQNAILDHPHLLFFQKIRASDALVGALAGRVPTRGEITLLEHIFGKDTADGLSGIARSPWREGLLNALNIPRSLMASFDFSAPFRQGLVVATRHPTIFTRNLGPMFKAFGSEKVYQAALDEIRARPSYPLMLEAKLPITELGRDIGGREERFASDWAEKITGGKYGPVRASGRAYTGFLDKLRADVFDHLIERAKAQGVNVQDPKFLQSLGTYIGSATGRGDLGALQEAGKTLNAVLFSPRLMYSRLNFLNPAYYHRLDPFARKEALRSALQLTGTVSTLLALASQVPGVRVITNPRNPDWGKIRIGNTRIDIAGGFQQELRLLAQLGTGEAISSTTGKKLSLTAGGYGKPTRLDILLRYFEGKAAPIASLALDKLRGSTQIGEKFTWGKAAATRMTPLLAQDSLDLYKERHGGMNGLLAALAGYGVGSVGFGVQTYGPKAPQVAPASGSGGGNDPYFGGSGGGGGGDPYFNP
jgi:hypothetical protein